LPQLNKWLSSFWRTRYGAKGAYLNTKDTTPARVGRCRGVHKGKKSLEFLGFSSPALHRTHDLLGKSGASVVAVVSFVFRKSYPSKNDRAEQIKSIPQINATVEVVQRSTIKQKNPREHCSRGDLHIITDNLK
jgi:hypothetical protein